MKNKLKRYCDSVATRWINLRTTYWNNYENMRNSSRITDTRIQVVYLFVRPDATIFPLFRNITYFLFPINNESSTVFLRTHTFCSDTKYLLHFTVLNCWCRKPSLKSTALIPWALWYLKTLKHETLKSCNVTDFYNFSNIQDFNYSWYSNLVSPFEPTRSRFCIWITKFEVINVSKEMIYFWIKNSWWLQEPSQ